MPYPPQYNPQFDLRKAQDDGDKLSATELRAELANIGTSLNQAITFLRAVTTVDMKIQPNQIIGTTFVIEDEQTAIAAQTVIVYANGITVDPLTATVGVFINGDRLPASQTTVQAADVIVTPALDAGDNIMLEIHDNGDSVFSQLQSIANALGASLVGVEDVAGVFATSNVEDALAEVMGVHNALVIALDDLTKYLLADVAVPLEIDQDASGFTWKNLAPGVDPNDPVVMSQISAVLAILTNLSATFLPLVGGIMQGPINLSNFRLVNVADPQAAQDGVNKRYSDDADTALDIRKLSLEGNKDTTANATLTGATFYQSTNDVDVADADQTSDPAGVTQPTMNDVPRPINNRQVANKVYVDDAAVAAVAGVQFPLGVFLKRGTNTQVKSLLTITQIGTGHHRITIPAGVTSLKLEGLGAGGGGGAGTGIGDGGDGGKTYYTVNAGSDQNLAMGGDGGKDFGGAAGAGGAIGSAADYGESGTSGTIGFGAGGDNYGGDGGSPSSQSSGPAGLGNQHAQVTGFGGVGRFDVAKAEGLGCGGGGGTASTTSAGGAGGGGAGYGEKIIAVVETDVIDLYEGNNGSGGGNGGAGADGFMRVRWGE